MMFEKLRRDSGSLEQYVEHGAAGRAAFGNNDFRRGPVNVAVIWLQIETNAKI